MKFNNNRDQKLQQTGLRSPLQIKSQIQIQKRTTLLQKMNMERSLTPPKMKMLLRLNQSTTTILARRFARRN